MYARTLRGIVCGLFVCAAAIDATPAAAQNGDGPTDEQWGAGLLVQFPGIGDFDAYSGGIGVEGQYRRWYGFGGFALAIGLEKWQTESRSKNWGVGGAEAERGRLSGDLTLVPIGGSAIGRWPIQEGLHLRGEAGLRYVWTDSNMRLRMPDWEQAEAIHVKDGWVVLAGLGLEQLITETVMLFGDLRYQHDLVRADARTDSTSLMSNHLRSFGLLVGLQVWF